MTNEFQTLISDFKKLPKVNINRTFIDICQMRGDRFEERCSQILQFYFDPNAEHNLRGLFINSLLETIGKSNENYSLSSVSVATEEVTEDRKRIDILIDSGSFIIAIENKINATLYNPLDSYARHIKAKHNGKTIIMIVLSVRTPTIDEREKMSNNEFIYVNYNDLFSAVKRNLGTYAIDGNQYYLTFLYDFIRTIENRYYNKNMEEINKFFFDNRDKVDEMITQYNRFKSSILEEQKVKIADIQERVSRLTGIQWWAWQNWDLGIDFTHKSHRLGIESSFSGETADNPLGDFHIYITVWTASHFAPYEEALRKLYPDCYIDKTAEGGRRVFLHLPVEKSKDADYLASKLAEYYKQVKEVYDNN